MNAIDLINSFNESGSELEVVDGQLKITAPKGLLTDELKSALRLHKLALIKLICANDPATTDPFEALRIDSELNLLPDDFRWLTTLLIGTSLDQTRELLTEYRSQWLIAMEGSHLEHQRENIGRHVANTWIRKEVARH